MAATATQTAPTTTSTTTNTTNATSGTSSTPGGSALQTLKPSRANTYGPRISISSVTPNNIGTLRKLNGVIFPVSYSDKFYKDVLLPEAEDFCKIVYYNDIPVGTVCCRIEKGLPAEPSKLYIMTMGVLAPYRNRGVGSQSLQHIITAASSPTSSFTTSFLPDTTTTSTSKSTKSKPQSHNPPPLPASSKISKIYLHVQVSNVEAKKFYEKHGFKEMGKVENYYKKIIPRDAWVLERDVETTSAGAEGKEKNKEKQ
jgi:ribosomal protein S18 acetylase RimI-like enzyme